MLFPPLSRPTSRVTFPAHRKLGMIASGTVRSSGRAFSSARDITSGISTVGSFLTGEREHRASRSPRTFAIKSANHFTPLWLAPCFLRNRSSTA